MAKYGSPILATRESYHTEPWQAKPALSPGAAHPSTKCVPSCRIICHMPYAMPCHATLNAGSMQKKITVAPPSISLPYENDWKLGKFRFGVAPAF